MKKIFILTLLSGFLCTGFFSQNPGDLDVTFSGDGIITTNVSGPDYNRDVVIQPDNKVLVAGDYLSHTNIYVMRYTDAGILDNTFDGDGRFMYSIGTGNEYCQGIVLQADGKIVITGSYYSGTNMDIYVIRLNSDGSFDTSFDTDGIVTFNIGTGDDFAYDVAIDGSGRIVVGGNTFTGSSMDFFVARLSGTDGSFDTSFDTDGIAITTIDPGDDVCYQVGIQSNGKIVASGTAGTLTGADLAVVNYNTDGSLNTGFSSDGIYRFSILEEDNGYAMEIQQDDKIVLAGYAFEVNYYLIMARVNTNGILDNTFCSGGTYSGSGTSDYVRALALQEDGKILLGGNIGDTPSDYALWRFNTDGSADTFFGTNGRVTTNIIFNGDYAYGVAVYNWKIVLVGGNWTGTDFNAGTARYWACTPPSLSSNITYQSVCEGEYAGFTVSPTGSVPFSYQWYHNGSPAGTDSPSFDISSATLSDNGTVYCEVTNACGNVSSNTTDIIVNPNPTASITGGGNYCVSTVQLDGNPSGGTGGYTHLWTGNTGTLSSTIIADPVLTMTAGTTYNLVYTVMDDSGCVATDNVAVTRDLAPVVNAGPDQSLCENNPNVTLNASVSNYTSILWTGGTGTFGSTTSLSTDYTPSAAEISSGTVTLTLTADNGTCTGYSDNLTIIFTPAPTVNAGLNQNICPGGPVNLNGSVTGATGGIWTGGVGTYSPDIYALTAVYTPSATEIMAGTVTLTLSTTGNGNCNAVSDDMTITIYSSPVADAGPDVSVCAGESTSLTASGGVTYNWSTLETTAAISVTPASTATYTVTVTNSSGCTDTDDVTVTVHTLPSVSITPDMPVVCSGQSVNLNGNPSGGSGSWASHSWTGDVSPFSSVIIVNPVFVTNIPGIYNIAYQVTDSYGCTATDVNTVTVAGNPVLIIDSVQNVLCNGYCDGIAYASATGGTPGYFFQWDANTGSQTVAAATNLCAGDFYVTVSDVNGCLDSAMATIQETTTLQMSLSQEEFIHCNGDSSAVVSSQASGGASPYSYQWYFDNGSMQIMPGETGDTLLNVPAGMYWLVITDDNGCDVLDSIIISQPDSLTATFSIDSTHCGQSDGIATVIPAGGTPGYYYQWDGSAGNQNTATATGLAAGCYTVTIMDSEGCYNIFTVCINDAPAGTATVFQLNGINCFGDSTAVIYSAMTGGNAPFDYIWSNAMTEDTLYNLGAGFYTVTVTDYYTCTATANYTITQPLQPGVDITPDSLDCFNDSDGSVSASAWGGTAPYSYLWSTGSYDSTLTGLNQGLYYLTVTDSGGCSFEDSTEVTSPPEIMISFVTNDASCGNNDGSASVTVSGGLPPYTYYWSSGDTIPNLSNLGAGIYMIEVTDDGNCTNNDYIAISDSDGPVVSVDNVTDVSCHNGNDGSADISISGGSTPYSFEWSTGDTGEDISGLPAGYYSIEVTDNNGCFGMGSIIILQPEQITAGLSIVNASCNTPDGSILSVSSGGTAPYTYLWSTGGTGYEIQNLTASVYGLTITDANSCTGVFDVITVNDQGGPVIIVDGVINTACSNTDGAVNVSISGGTQPYAGYLWSDSSTDEDLSGVAAGAYSMTVTDDNGCIGVISAEVGVIPPSINPVCMVSVDSASGKAVVIWEKVQATGIDHYNIYREGTQSGNYYLAGSVQSSSVCIFTDNVADPSLGSKKYRISAIDDCGAESQQSSFHQTIHLTMSQGTGNEYILNWNFYTGFTPDLYYIYRYSQINGWEMIDVVTSGNTYTDSFNPPAGNLMYYVEAVKPGAPCTAGNDYFAAGSNVASMVIIGIGEINTEGTELSAFPNPFDDVVNISYCIRTVADVKLEVFNVTGERIALLVDEKQTCGKYLYTMPASETGYSPGVYIVKLTVNGTILTGKIVETR